MQKWSTCETQVKREPFSGFRRFELTEPLYHVFPVRGTKPVGDMSNEWRSGPSVQSPFNHLLAGMLNWLRTPNCFGAHISTPSVHHLSPSSVCPPDHSKFVLSSARLHPCTFYYFSWSPLGLPRRGSLLIRRLSASFAVPGPRLTNVFNIDVQLGTFNFPILTWAAGSYCFVLTFNAFPPVHSWTSLIYYLFSKLDLTR